MSESAIDFEIAIKVFCSGTGTVLGRIVEDVEEWAFFTGEADMTFSAVELRAISEKLDELNNDSRT